MLLLKKEALIFLFSIDLTLAQILVMVNQEPIKKEYTKSTIIKDQNETKSIDDRSVLNETILNYSNDSFSSTSKETVLSVEDSSSSNSLRNSSVDDTVPSVEDTSPSNSPRSSSVEDSSSNNSIRSSPKETIPSVEDTSSSNSAINDSISQTSNEKNQIFTCPFYVEKHNSTNEILDFMKDTYEDAIDLCNTSSRVGCKYSNSLRQISSCLNSKYFDFNDIRAELSENKDLLELPRQGNEPVLGFVIFKILNIDAISVKDMDFKMDFYLGVTWDIKGEFFRKYMTRLCVSKKVDMEKKQSLLLYQEDLKLFWLPDLYFPNSKSNSKDEEKTHLKRPISRNYLEISFKKDEQNNPYLRFIFVTSGHSNLLCPMKFDDYPNDVQECVVKIRSFYYYLDELRLIWYFLSIENLELQTLEYSISLSKGQDLEEDHFVVTAGDLNKNFTRLLIHLNFTRQLTSKLFGIYLPSMMLNTLNYLTYYFGVNSYPSRSSIGIMVLLTLTIMFSNVRSELPGSTSISDMEIWLICCFICDLIQLIEASIVESIYTNHCIDYYLRKKEKRELETEFLGYSYSMLFDDTTDDEDDYFEDKSNKKFCSLSKLITFLGDLIAYLILPSVSRKKPEYWSVFVDKIFRIVIPILFGILLFWHLRVFRNTF